jgi:hypothetical protein
MADEDLLDTIESIRKDSYPDLPAGLVKEIALIEIAHTENLVEGSKRLAEAVNIYLDKVTSSDSEKPE